MGGKDAGNAGLVGKCRAGLRGDPGGVRTE